MEPLVTLEWADNWFETCRPKASEWQAATEAEKQRYLNWASSVIRSAFTFSCDVVPEENEQVHIAACEQALWLMRRPDEYPELLTLGLSQASAGPLSATFSKEYVAPYLCEAAVVAIGDLAEFEGGNAGRIKSRSLGW